MPKTLVNTEIRVNTFSVDYIFRTPSNQFRCQVYMDGRWLVLDAPLCDGSEDDFFAARKKAFAKLACTARPAARKYRAISESMLNPKKAARHCQFEYFKDSACGRPHETSSKDAKYMVVSFVDDWIYYHPYVANIGRNVPGVVPKAFANTIRKDTAREARAIEQMISILTAEIADDSDRTADARKTRDVIEQHARLRDQMVKLDAKAYRLAKRVSILPTRT